MWMLAIFILLDPNGDPGRGMTAAPQVEMAGGFADRMACEAIGRDVAARTRAMAGDDPGLRVDWWCYPQD